MRGTPSDKRMGLSFTIAVVLASVGILKSKSHGTRDHILLSQIQDFPFCHLLQLRGYGGGIEPHLCFDSSDITLGRTSQKAPLLPVALLQCDIAVVADHIENFASNSSSVVVFISMAAVTWHLLSHCLAMGVFAEPYSSNSWLCYLHNSGFQQRCHMVTLLYWILVTLSSQNSSVSNPVFISTRKLVLCGLQL
jgi:hypothetical protein